MLVPKVRGLAEFKAYIDTLARKMRGVATEAITDYLIGNGSHGFKHYPPYKLVTRTQAYGQPFVSARQRRYVMARIKEGSIDPGYPHRTGELQQGWHKVGTGVNARAVNEVGYAPYVMGTKDQARQPGMVGWRKIADIISTNIKGAVRHAEAKIKEIRRGS